MNVVELGADSKRLLIEIRDRLPAATTPPAAPDGLVRWEIFGPREQAVLVAWVTPGNQVAWTRKDAPPNAPSWRPIYVRAES